MDRVQMMATPQRFVSVNVLVIEIQKQLLDYGGPWQGVEDDLLTLLAHFRAQRMGLKEFCTRLRVLIGAAVLMATVQGLAGQAAKDIFKDRPAKRTLVKEEVLEVKEEATSAPAAASTGPLKKHRAWSCSGDSVGDSQWTPAEAAHLGALPVLDRQTAVNGS